MSDLISLCFKLAISKVTVIIVLKYIFVMRISNDDSDINDDENDDLRGQKEEIVIN